MLKEDISDVRELVLDRNKHEVVRVPPCFNGLLQAASEERSEGRHFKILDKSFAGVQGLGDTVRAALLWNECVT